VQKMRSASHEVRGAGKRMQRVSSGTTRSTGASWLLSSVFLLLLGLLAGLLLVSAAVAQSPELDDVTVNDVNRVARQLYCPVCPNTPLDVCETQACRDWRELIRERLVAGDDDQQIIDYFVDQYGQRVLAEPPAEGFNILIWLIPGGVLVAGLIALVVILRSWAARRPDSVARSSPTPGEALPADYVERVERELRARR
jgi:cytochrome c-type biogenesis protein CcmH